MKKAEKNFLYIWTNEFFLIDDLSIYNKCYVAGTGEEQAQA